MTRAADSDTLTEGIRVQASAWLVPDAAEDDFHVYAYRITMHNEGTKAARLLDRHWVVLDAENGRKDVRGPGVVGAFPRLDPGESFTYVSSCPLRTPWGSMEGSFGFERDDKSRFAVAVERFFLAPSSDTLEAAASWDDD